MFICHVTSPPASIPRLVLSDSPQECTPTGLKKLAGTSANTQSWDCAGILQESVGDNKDLTPIDKRLTCLCSGDIRHFLFGGQVVKVSQFSTVSYDLGLVYIYYCII